MTMTRMETVYKVTRPDRTTYRGFTYELGQDYRFPGNGALCSSAYSHAYRTPAHAVLFNPIHGAYNPMLLFEAQGTVARDDGTKLGLTSIRLIAQREAPTFSIAARTAWAVACVWPTCTEEKWRTWASGWLMDNGRRAPWAVWGATDEVWGAAAAEWAAADAWGLAAEWAAAAAEWAARKIRTADAGAAHIGHTTAWISQHPIGPWKEWPQ